MTTPLRLVNKVKSTKNRYFSISIFSVYICIQFPQIYSWKKGKNFFFLCVFVLPSSLTPILRSRESTSIHSLRLSHEKNRESARYNCLFDFHILVFDSAKNMCVNDGRRSLHSAIFKFTSPRPNLLFKKYSVYFSIFALLSDECWVMCKLTFECSTSWKGWKSFHC